MNDGRTTERRAMRGWKQDHSLYKREHEHMSRDAWLRLFALWLPPPEASITFANVHIPMDDNTENTTLASSPGMQDSGAYDRQSGRFRGRFREAGAEEGGRSTKRKH